MNYSNALATIVELTDRIPDPLGRVRERQRLCRELYQRQAFAAQVNEHLTEGWTVREIAQELHASVEDVRNVVVYDAAA